MTSEKAVELPFTLSHPAAVLPLLRPPFVPAALVAGAMAPDAPYFLGAVGLSATSSQDWYEPFLNATTPHSPAGLAIGLPLTVGSVAVWRMLRGPLTALLPSGLRVPVPVRRTGHRPGARYALWLLLSALIGIATHLAWDSFTHGEGVLTRHLEPLHATIPGDMTVARLLQHASTALGLVLVGRHLWRRRGRLRCPDAADTAARLGPVMRWGVVTTLVVAPLLGGAVMARDDFHAYRYVTEEDHSRPVTVDPGNGVSGTAYPGETVRAAPWGAVVEGVSSGFAKRAGASFAVALLLYSAAWQTSGLRRGPATAPPAPVAPRPPLRDR
uniref:DUF4184 family protein n=1 Tax=Streptomyces sp. NBC_01401 TaxID=2903854 RepID=A0AAU3GNI5_9ACTN